MKFLKLRVKLNNNVTVEAPYLRKVPKSVTCNVIVQIALDLGTKMVNWHYTLT